MGGGHRGGGSPEAQPHLFGAQALHWRQGGSVCNTDTPPVWCPEMAHDPHYPYSLREYTKEVGRWLAATKVAEHRQGPLLSLAIGGAGRTIADQVEDLALINGGDLDLDDGQASDTLLALSCCSGRFG